MARIPRPLTLEYSAQALDDLTGIWEWNAGQRGLQHADNYIAFLKAETLKLARSSSPGRPVPTRTTFRYALIRRRHQGYGHLVVFTVDLQTLRILRYYHTSQDWQTKLTAEP